MYENMYGQSQYVRLDPIQNLPDEYLYSLAAWKYINGENPAIFNADQPPLGKYIIGSGILLFGNEKVTTPIFVVITIILFFFICKVVVKSTLLALLATVIFSLEKLLLVQMVYAPLLDIYQLFFTLLTLLFAVLSIEKWRYIIPTMVAIGCVMGTKYFATGVVLMTALLGDGILRVALSYVHKKKKKKQKVLSFLSSLPALKRFLYIVLALPVAVITLLFTYLPAYWQGYTPKMILGVQRYIYEFHSQKIHFHPFDVWQLLLFNRWHVPWENVFKPSVDWQISWPLVAVGAMLMTAIFFKHRLAMHKKHTLEQMEVLQFIVVWSIVYAGTLMSANIVPRYALPLLPALYILTFALIRHVVTKYKDIIHDTR